MIRVKGLEAGYGKETALAGVDLCVPANSTCAVIGPSGCGKTTLLYILAGLLEPAKGIVEINGQEQKGIRQDTGIILQNTGLLPWKTVWENVALGLKARNIERKATDESVNNILAELDMLEHRDKYPAELSGGQKQRVAIARTLVTHPDLLLLDEASSALDAITKEQIQNLILKIYKKNPVTLVLVTHSIEEAVFLGQKIVVMEKAGIKQIISNPYFGDEDIRTKPYYHDKCLEIRKCLDGDGR